MKKHKSNKDNLLNEFLIASPPCMSTLDVAISVSNNVYKNENAVTKQMLPNKYRQAKYVFYTVLIVLSWLIPIFATIYFSTALKIHGTGWILIIITAFFHYFFLEKRDNINQ